MYNAFNCTLDRYREQHDNWNSIMAGGLTGALFRCTGEPIHLTEIPITLLIVESLHLISAGPQKMLIASSLMAAGAMGWSTAKPHLI